MSVAGNNYQMSGATVASVTANSIVLAAGAPTIAGTGVPLTIQLPAITQTLTIGGNLINNGTFDMSKATSTANSSTTVCNVIFNNTTGDQTISGTTPALTRFQGVTLSKSVITNKVISTIDTYIGGSAFTLTAGTWNQHAGNLINANGSKTIATGKLLIDGTASYTNYVGSSYQLPVYTSGSLAVTGGTFEVNTTGKVQIGVGNNSITCTTPGVINLISGNVYVYGKIMLTTGTATFSGANVYTNPNPSATSGTYANAALLTSASPLSTGSNQFEVSGAGVFNFTSGSVTLVNPLNAAAAGRDLKITSTGTLNITTGATIYIGDGSSTTASTGSAIYNGFINGSTATIGANIVVQTGNIPGRYFSLSKANLVVSGTLTVASNGVLDCGAGVVSGAGTFTLASGGNIKTSIATGINGAITTTGANTLSTGANYEFDGPTASAVTGTLMPATVNSLIINNATGVSLSQATTVSGTTSVTAGSILKTGAFTFTNNGTATITGSFQIDQGGWATGTNFVYGTAGSLIFNNVTGSYGVNSDVFWPATSGPVNVNVLGAGGITLNVPRTVTGTFQTSAAVGNTFGNNLTVSGTGTVQINANGYFSNFSPTYSNTATLVYNTTGTYGANNEWGAGTTVGYGVPQNVTVLNNTAVSLSGTRTVPGSLTLTSGKISLGANNLTIGAIGASSASNYIVTDGAGSLTQPVALSGTVVFPIGASTSSYDPVIVNPLSATNVSARVYSTLSGAVPSGYSYNAREWNVSSNTPSSTVVTLTPSVATATGIYPRIGQYNGTNYTNIGATLTGNSYAATFTTFGQFVTGMGDATTGVSQAVTIAGVTYDGQVIHNASNVDLKVFDATGRLMVSSNKDVNMNSYSNGIYIVRSNQGFLKIIK